MPGIGREIEQARGLQRDVFCAGCGYNLRTRSRVGRCPECGGEYDARPLGMRGILLPQDIRFPFEDYFTVVLSAGLGLGGLYLAVVDGIVWAWAPAVPLLVSTLVFAVLAVRRTVKWVRYRSLIKSLSDHESE